MRETENILVIGAGAAGLAAANRLLAQGFSVTVLEARARTGGRICTQRPPELAGPVELGAEFLHGDAPEVVALVNPRSLQRAEKPQHCLFWRGELLPLPRFDRQLASWLSRLPCTEGDRPMLDFVESLNVTERERALLHDYLEGFNAADLRLMSECAFREESNASGDFTSLARIKDGYDLALQPLLRNFPGPRARLVLEAQLRHLEWRQGFVRAISETPQGDRVDEAARAVVTLPVSILALDRTHSSYVRFTPGLREKSLAARSLMMGLVVRVGLLFREPVFGESDQLCFTHSPELAYGTRWSWSRENPAFVTSWSGGSRAYSLYHQSRDRIITQALQDLGTVTGRPLAALEAGLRCAYFHHWEADPFSLGAYAFAKTGARRARRELAASVADTLFFAGEATTWDGSSGTVHGALRSGYRAAAEIFAVTRLAQGEKATESAPNSWTSLRTSEKI